jgi:hypothetical protein
MAKRTMRPVGDLIAGAKPADMPGFIKPQLATLFLKASSGSTKSNSMATASSFILTRAGRRSYTRNGLDWTSFMASPSEKHVGKYGCAGFL